MKTNRKKSNIKLQEQEMSSPQRSTFRWNEDSNDTATQSLWIWLHFDDHHVSSSPAKQQHTYAKRTWAWWENNPPFDDLKVLFRLYFQSVIWVKTVAFSPFNPSWMSIFSVVTEIWFVTSQIASKSVLVSAKVRYGILKPPGNSGNGLHSRGEACEWGRKGRCNFTHLDFTKPTKHILQNTQWNKGHHRSQNHLYCVHWQGLTIIKRYFSTSLHSPSSHLLSLCCV